MPLNIENWDGKHNIQQQNISFILYCDIPVYYSITMDMNLMCTITINIYIFHVQDNFPHFYLKENPFKFDKNWSKLISLISKAHFGSGKNILDTTTAQMLTYLSFQVKRGLISPLLSLFCTYFARNKVGIYKPSNVHSRTTPIYLIL